MLQQLRTQGLKIAEGLQPAVLTLARLTLAVVFIQSGWGKLHHLDKVTAFFTELGIPAPAIQAPFVAGMEFLCGIAMLLGLLTRLAALPIIAIMIVAIVTAKHADIESATDVFGLTEYLYIVLALQLVAYGAGPLSVDARLKR